ncbi:MAG: hypothetical protein ACREJQ_06390 [bacterium]
MRAILTLIVIILAVVGAWYLYNHSGIGATPIGKIQQNPRDYDGRVVTISGEVTERVSIFDLKYYTVKDKTGEIHVVTKKTPPETGTRVTVRGKVQEAFAIGGAHLVVLVEEESN